MDRPGLLPNVGHRLSHGWSQRQIPRANRTAQSDLDMRELVNRESQETASTRIVILVRSPWVYKLTTHAHTLHHGHERPVSLSQAMTTEPKDMIAKRAST